MAIMPRFKPGQLVRHGHGALQLVGLVKKTMTALRRGAPAYVLVQWCGKHQQTEEYIPQDQLKLAEKV